MAERKLGFVVEYTGPEEQREQAEKDLRDPVKWAALLRVIAASVNPPVDSPVLEKLFMRSVASPDDQTPMTDADLVWEAVESTTNE